MRDWAMELAGFMDHSPYSKDPEALFYELHYQASYEMEGDYFRTELENEIQDREKSEKIPFKGKLTSLKSQFQAGQYRDLPKLRSGARDTFVDSIDQLQVPRTNHGQATPYAESCKMAALKGKAEIAEVLEKLSGPLTPGAPCPPPLPSAIGSKDLHNPQTPISVLTPKMTRFCGACHAEQIKLEWLQPSENRWWIEEAIRRVSDSRMPKAGGNASSVEFLKHSDQNKAAVINELNSFLPK